MSFRHVSLLALRPDTSTVDRAAIVDALRALPAAIAAIDHYSIGVDAGLADDNFDIVVVADFADRDAFFVYRDHAEHQAVLTTLIRPHLDARAAVQYEVED